MWKMSENFTFVLENLPAFSSRDITIIGMSQQPWLHITAHLVPSKGTPWPLVHERTIPTERPPLVDEI
jgi:hypothetical protein